MDTEEFNRNVQRVVRGEERTYRLRGIVIDQNLEAKDEGQTAAIFVMFIPVIVTCAPTTLAWPGWCGPGQRRQSVRPVDPPPHRS